MRVTVPVRNEDGSIKYEVSMNEKEQQAILQFGLNMAVAMGIASQIMDGDPDDLMDEDFEGELPN